MRKQIAHQLHRLADWFYTHDHTETLVIKDEYDICRAQITVTADDFQHGVETTFVQLPQGWKIGE